jgi:hypothetical protein
MRGIVRDGRREDARRHPGGGLESRSWRRIGTGPGNGDAPSERAGRSPKPPREAVSGGHTTIAEIEGRSVSFIGREALIKNKEASGRLKDVADVARLRKTHPGQDR